MMREASFYEVADAGKVKCTLCPQFCILKDGNYGNCRVRYVSGGKLYTEAYGKVAAIHVDPIEKKPLYHFYPGRQVLSLGSVGCNLHCRFCQNDSISQVRPGEAKDIPFYSPEEIVSRALHIRNNIGIAFTYNEPVVWFEYMLETARLAKHEGLSTVMVTNGYINPEPLTELIPFIDAFSIDIKGFTDSFYRRLTSSTLEPVKKTISRISSAGNHFELVNLIIPGENDDPVQFFDMMKWIKDTCGPNTVLHLSRYFPHYQFSADPTPVSTINTLYRAAKSMLSYVYTGNMQGKGNHTECPKCGTTLIFREGYSVSTEGITSFGDCRTCCEKILKYC